MVNAGAGYLFILGSIIINMGCNGIGLRSSVISWRSEAMFTSADGLRRIGVAGAVTGVFGDYMVVAGGANFPLAMPWDGGDKIYHDSGTVYRIVAESELVRVGLFKMSLPVAYSACVSTSKGIVYAGGENANGPTSRAGILVYDSAHGGIVEKALPDLPYEVTNGSMTCDGNRLYFVGGEGRDVVHENVLSLNLDDSVPSWTEVDTLPMPITHGFAAIVDRDGINQLFVAGGRRKRPGRESEIYSDAFRYDSSDRKWKRCRSFPTPIAAGTCISTPRGGVLLIGGDEGEFYKRTESLIHAISRESDSRVRDGLVNQRKELQRSHPGFSNLVWLYDGRSDEWVNIGSIPYHTPVTTTAVVSNRKVWIPSGEVRPGVRSDHILIGDLGKYIND